MYFYVKIVILVLVESQCLFFIKTTKNESFFLNIMSGVKVLTHHSVLIFKKLWFSLTRYQPVDPKVKGC